MSDQDIKMIDQVKNSRDFTGKVVLVTGSGEGIGKAIAKLFAGLGAQVVIHGRNPEKVSTAAKQVNQLSPYKLKALEIFADLSDTSQVDRVVDETVKQFGRLDVLVNNAGSFHMDTIEAENLLDIIDKSLAIDLKATLKITQQSIPHLCRTKGSIINISWTFLSIPLQGYLGYQIAKAGIEISTKVLAQELGPKGIRINCIRPGINNSHDIAGTDEHTVKRTPLGRIGQNSDITKVVAFLASTDAQFITGSIIDVDGGLALGIGGSFMKDSIFAQYSKQ